MRGISIIICCYNSAQRLPETIKHIALQEVDDDFLWEVIVVNNASTDDTASVALAEWNKYKANASFKVIEELTPGLIYARSRGIQEAKYEYVLFCDDDNWLKEDYVRQAVLIMDENPQIGALGGQGIGITDGEFPIWWEKEKGCYAVGKQAEVSRDVTKREYLWGAGLVSRRNILLKVFNPKYPFLMSGRTGNLILSGDDSEICSRIILLGHTLYYDEKLCFKHDIPSVRLTDEYLKRMYQGFASIKSITSKYSSAVFYRNMSINKRNSFFFKRLLSAFFSGFSERKLELLREFVLFGMGIKCANNKIEISIHDFIFQK